VESPLAEFFANADVDSIADLLHHREFQSFFVFATPSGYGASRRVADTSHHGAKAPTRFRSSGSRCPIKDASVATSTKIPAPLEFSSRRHFHGGPFPDYVSPEFAGRAGCREESTSAFVIHHGDRRLFHAPSIPAGLAKLRRLERVIESNAVPFLDGTFWSDDGD